MALIARRISHLGTENAFKLGDDIQRCVDRGMDVIRFNLGAPDFRSAPHLNRVASEALAAGRSGYCDPAGILPFREAIAAHVTRTRGVEVGPERVVVTPGAKPPIGYTLQTYVDEGDEVIYPSPGFPIYESWVQFVGAVRVPLHLSDDRDFAFNADDLASLVTEHTKLIILCSPSNPTGGVLSRAELAGIAELIRERCRPDIRIYSDEIYEQILFDGLEHESIVSHPGMEERTVIASGHSKGFAMTGWRLGWAVLPTAREAAIFKRININIMSCVPPFLQEAGVAAYEDPASAVEVRRMVDAFEERRDWIVPALNAVPGVRCRTPKGAFYVFPDVSGICRRLGVGEAHAALPAGARSRTSPAAMLQMFLLYRYGVATMDRASFGRIGAEGQDFLRLSIANSMDDIRRGVARIGEAAKDDAGFAGFIAEEAARGDEGLFAPATLR
ncbi:MAG: aminotransferase class I/II-fold pyridoxal phosphate-dependent enzyme [Gemmatimonadetes bacterium]|nr:aminotransferase class I/II-fold pyridoxal phosphate-dependent enzyme [Gemmatimonadota bacterium]MYE69772.1 aminotransferase class I/II-fold pyridoxal phosphate-dependent enzyme [Gemmatimonadota bacterium]MYJ69025.1 aminotransferase class I/II-fold pyridoxal phosphate-dependent enzyme [Gemmatimonadota bacterium]